MNFEQRSLIPAEVAFREGALYAPRFGDIYHSVDGSVAEVNHVFLRGNGLPQRWQAHRSFTIIETGFGCGLNFLATWDLLRQSGAACRIDFVSVEQHPFQRDDLAPILRAWPQLDAFSQELLRAYPPLVPGFHRVHLDDGRINLTLLLGDAAQMLAELDARADAFFLDGFAPAKNPQMWSAALFEHVHRLAAPGCTAATYSAAAVVRKGLDSAGFAVTKVPGFARKRDMLTAIRPGNREKSAGTRRVAVIGAGIAGASCAFALARRGVEVDLLDREACVGAAASLNPAAVVRPFLTLDRGVRNRFSWSAYTHAVRLYRRLSGDGEFAWRETGVLQLPRNAGHWAMLRRAVAALCYPAELVQLVDAVEASQLCGVPVDEDGVWFPTAGFLSGQNACAALIGAVSPSVKLHTRVNVNNIDDESGIIRIRDSVGSVITHADAVILANGFDAQAFIGAGAVQLRRVRGQVTRIADFTPGLRAPVCRNGYLTPPIDDGQLCGATFDELRGEAAIFAEDDAVNLRRAAHILPIAAQNARLRAGSAWSGVRCVSRDWLPLVGRLPGNRLNGNLYCCVAMGSRGFGWAPLAAEMIASIVAGAPAPLERTVSQRLLPERC